MSSKKSVRKSTPPSQRKNGKKSEWTPSPEWKESMAELSREFRKAQEEFNLVFRGGMRELYVNWEVNPQGAFNETDTEFRKLVLAGEDSMGIGMYACYVEEVVKDLNKELGAGTITLPADLQEVLDENAREAAEF